MAEPPKRPFRPPSAKRETQAVLKATPGGAARGVLSKPPPSQPAPLPPGARGRGGGPPRGVPRGARGARGGRGVPPGARGMGGARPLSANRGSPRGRGMPPASAVGRSMTPPARGARNSYRSSTIADPMATPPSAVVVPLPPSRESRSGSLSRLSQKKPAPPPRASRVGNMPDLAVESPSTVIVHVPGHDLRLEVESFERFIVDDFLDNVFAKLREKNVVLKGDRDEVNREYYGLFLPAHNTWCRNFKKVTDYSLWTRKGGTPIAELRLKTKFKEKRQAEARAAIPAKRKIVLTSDQQEDVARRKRLPLTLPELGLEYHVECDPSTTAQLLLQYIGNERPDLQENMVDYTIIATTSSAITPGAVARTAEVVLKPEDKLGSLGRMKNVAGLEARRETQRLQVKLANGSQKEFKFHPDRTMLELQQYIITTERLLGRYDKACLYYQPAKGSGMVVDPTRTLRSYRMTKADHLELVPDQESKKRRTHNPSTVEPAVDHSMYIKVHCKEFNCNRTLKLNADATVAEAIYHFSKKVQAIHDPGMYGLYPYKGEKQLETGRTLVSYKIPSMAELVIKRHNTGTSNAIFQRKVVFGVDPATLDLEDAESDYGSLRVPKVLVDLQKAFMAVRALDVENIFKAKGNEKRMREIEDQLNGGSFPETEDYSTYDAHDIAGLIKLWFGRIPHPVLSKLDEDALAMCAIDEEECIELPGSLPEPYRSMFIWLLELLFEVAKNSKVNEMESHAIGRAWAPFLLDRPNDAVRRTLLEQEAKNILTFILEYLLSEWGRGIHGGALKSQSAFANMRKLRQSGFILQTTIV